MLPRLDITKALAGVVQVGDDPVFDVSYAFVLRNTSEVPAPNAQLVDDLATAFAPGRPAISVQSGPTLGGGDAALTLASGADAFNGTTRTAILTGTDTIAPGAERTIMLTVRLRFPSARDIPVGVDLTNTARVTTSVTPAGSTIAADDSTDATRSSAAPASGDVPEPTVLRFTPRPRLSIEKIAGALVAELGDSVQYTVRVRNLGGPTLPEVTVTDRLPIGFRYIPGSARLAGPGGSAAATPSADPAGGEGPVLTFVVPAQSSADSVTLIYRARVGPGALQGDGVNRAEASSGPVRSAEARARVTVHGGVFTTDACVIGRIFADTNDNRMQDEHELGVPGVRLVFEEGTTLLSDVEGKYSYCGLTPGTHVLKVDRTTLPSGAVLVPSGNRNAGDGDSLFVDLKFGELHRADFVEGSNDKTVHDAVTARRALGDRWAPVFEEQMRSSAIVRDWTAQHAAPIPSSPFEPATSGRGGRPEASGQPEIGATEAQTPPTRRFVEVAPRVPLDADNSNLPGAHRKALEPAPVGAIALTADREEAPADGHSVVRLAVRVTDASGQPVRGPVVATIESSEGRIQLPGAPSAEGGDGGDADRVTPGTQVLVENGEAVVHLLGPAVAQDVRVRAVAGQVAAEGTVSFVPDLRPMMAVGLLEGMVSLTNVDAAGRSPARAYEAFDRELRRFSRSFENGEGLYGGRGALFLKGRVKGHTLLTMAYDSDKDTRGVLFRDIQPEAFYPVYGDASIKSFDAQSSGRFYLRADRGRSYVLYGDLQTAAFGRDAQNLGTYSRSLTGLQHHFEHRDAVANVFASRDSLRQVIDEIGGRGVSGPYSVSNPNGVTGTEKVEIVTRDRNQPAVILSAVPLSRFTDYEFEPFGGRLLFKRPVPALDERLNPVSIRVTYEVEYGGEKAWVAGADGQVTVGRRLQLGGSWAEDTTDGAPFRLHSVNGTLAIGRFTSIVAEGARTTGTINTNGFNQTSWRNLATLSEEVEGTAARVELRHQSARLAARAFAGSSEPGFNNPSSTLTGGRTEAGGRATFALTHDVRVVGEGLRSEDRLTGGSREGGTIGIEGALSRALGFEMGVRRAKESGQTAQGTSAGVLPFGLSASPGGFGLRSTNHYIDPISGQPIVNPGFSPTLSAGAQPLGVGPLDVLTLRGQINGRLGKIVDLYGEAEQDVREADKRLAAIGGHVRISERNQLYARHEFVSSLSGPYALNVDQRTYGTVVGLSSSYMQNGDAFSEYRLGDAMSGREAHAAIGLRNLWPLAEGIRLSTGLERLQTFTRANQDQTATAASLGLEYTRSPKLKGTGRVEWRHDPSSDSWFSTVGLAHKVSRDWTVLGKNFTQFVSPRSTGAPNQVQDRLAVGAAFRDTRTNRLNLLSRYEFRFEDMLGSPTGLGTKRQVHVVSTHADLHPVRAWTVSGQHAAKWVDDRTDPVLSTFRAQLLSGRVGYDLTKRVDLGALASVMWSPHDGRRHALGGELGFLLRANLWLSLGYNATGFTDRDLVLSNYTTKGVFVRLRMKVDEDLFAREHAPRAAREPRRGR